MQHNATSKIIMLDLYMVFNLRTKTNKMTFEHVTYNLSYFLLLYTCYFRSRLANALSYCFWRLTKPTARPIPEATTGTTTITAMAQSGSAGPFVGVLSGVSVLHSLCTVETSSVI